MPILKFYSGTCWRLDSEKYCVFFMRVMRVMIGKVQCTIETLKKVLSYICTL